MKTKNNNNKATFIFDLISNESKIIRSSIKWLDLNHLPEHALKIVEQPVSDKYVNCVTRIGFMALLLSILSGCINSFEAEISEYNTEVYLGESVELGVAVSPSDSLVNIKSLDSNAGTYYTHYVLEVFAGNSDRFMGDLYHSCKSNDSLAACKEERVLEFTPTHSGEYVIDHFEFFSWESAEVFPIIDALFHLLRITTNNTDHTIINIEVNTDVPFATFEGLGESLRACTFISDGPNVSDITEMDCSGLEIDHLLGVDSLSNLRSIDLSNTSIDYLRMLTHLENLETLNVENTGVDCSEAKSLRYGKSPDLEITGVNLDCPDLISVQEISFKNNRCGSFGNYEEGYHFHPRLAFTDDFSWSFDCELEDWNDLAYFNKVRFLTIPFAKDPLPSLIDFTALETLDLWYYEGTLEFLSGNTSVRDIELRDSRVSDLSPLSTLPNLSSVNINKVETLTCAEVEALRTSRPDVSVRYDEEC